MQQTAVLQHAAVKAISRGAVFVNGLGPRAAPHRHPPLCAPCTALFGPLRHYPILKARYGSSFVEYYEKRAGK